MEKNYKFIKVESKDNIWTVAINKPEAMNAIDMNVLEEMISIFNNINKEKSCRVVVLKGEGKAFCAGGDFSLPLFDNTSSKMIFTDMERFGELIFAIKNLSMPIIAAVNGAAVGAGMNIALACDIIICSENAKFGEVFSRIGVHPDCGGTYFLPRLVGTYKACELMFLGDIFGAKEAKEIGIVNKVVESDKFNEEVENFAKNIAKGPPFAISLIKKSIYKGIENDLNSQLKLESLNQTMCMLSEDKKEGISAFKEKRKPKFKGQ